MSGVITTGSNPKLLWPGLNKIWGMTYPFIFDEILELSKKWSISYNVIASYIIEKIGVVFTSTVAFKIVVSFTAETKRMK